MIKFSYKQNNEVKEVTFNKYYELIRFVAMNRIADEDFVSMNLNADDEESKDIIGLDGLVDKALETSDRMEEAERAFEEMMANISSDDEEDCFDEEEDEFYA